MPSLPHFIGGSYHGQARIVGSPFTCNSYVGQGDASGALPALLPRPAYTPFVSLPGAPVRGIFWQDGRGFAVSAGVFCEYLASQTFLVRGFVAEDANPVFISSNGQGGNQVFVVSGGHGYIFDLVTSAFTDVSTQSEFPFPAIAGGFVGSYFWALQANSITFALSNIENGLIWDINQGGSQSISLASDNINSGLASHDQLWFPGSKTTSIWFQSGAADFPFQPVPSTYIQWGIDGPFTLAQHDNGLIMTGRNEQGSRVVLQSNGYDWSVISTPGISNLLTALPSMDGAIGWTYAMTGHPFYILSVPGLDTSLCYDGATKSWTNRGVWNPKTQRFTPDIGRCCCYGFNNWLVGDRQSGTIYMLSPATAANATFDTLLVSAL